MTTLLISHPGLLLAGIVLLLSAGIMTAYTASEWKTLALVKKIGSDRALDHLAVRFGSRKEAADAIHSAYFPAYLYRSERISRRCMQFAIIFGATSAVFLPFFIAARLIVG